MPVQHSPSTGSTPQSLLLTLTAGLSKQNNLSHSTPPKHEMSIPVVSSRTPGQVVFVRLMSIKGSPSVVPDFFPRSISPPSHQCRHFPMNCTSMSVHSSFRFCSNFVILFVTRSLRTRGQHAFRSLFNYATAIIGPYSRVYGSLSCSCKRAKDPVSALNLKY